MTLKEFVDKVKRGEFQTAAGQYMKGSLVEYTKPLAPVAEDVTAEAFNQGILDSNSTTWEQAIAQVKALLTAKP